MPELTVLGADRIADDFCAAAQMRFAPALLGGLANFPVFARGRASGRLGSPGGIRQRRRAPQIGAGP
jgi:hypothetical protein